MRTNAIRHLRRIVLLLPLTLLAGCFDMQADIELNMDGSGSAAIGYALTEDFLKSGPLENMILRKDGQAYIDRNKVLKRFEDREGITLKDLDLWREEDKHYLRIMLDFENIAQLGDRNVQYEWALEDGAWVLRIIVRKEKAAAGRDEDGQREALRSALYDALSKQGFHFRVHLPRKIIDSNADEVRWNVAEFFVPVSFFLKPEATTRILYARVEATTWERVRWWVSSLFS